MCTVYFILLELFSIEFNFFYSLQIFMMTVLCYWELCCH